MSYWVSGQPTSPPRNGSDVRRCLALAPLRAVLAPRWICGRPLVLVWARTALLGQIWRAVLSGGGCQALVAGTRRAET